MTSKRVITLETSNDTTTDIFTLNTTINTGYLLNFEAIAYNTTDNKSGSISGMIKINQGSINTTPTVSNIINYITILDSELSLISVDNTISNNTFKLNITGEQSKNIKWRILIKIVS